MQKWATTYNALFAGSIIEQNEGLLYNTAVIVDATGLVTSHRKIALTKIDYQFFSSGKQITTFQYQGIKMGILICFDIWFPEMVREYTKQGVEVLLHPTNYGGGFTPKIATARAIENQMYILSCNRTGKECIPGLEVSYAGGSQMIEPWGEQLLHMDHHVGIQTAPLPLLQGDTPEPVIKKVLGMELITKIEELSSTW